MFSSGRPVSKARKSSPRLRNLLVALFVVFLLFAAAMAQLSGLGIYLLSIGRSSAKVGIDAAVDNNLSDVVFQSASFQAYGNNIPFLNGTAYSYFPSAGSNSTDTLELTLPYSKVGSLLWSALSGGGKVSYRLTGMASFSTPLGQADLPLNISVLSSRVSMGSTSATLEATAAVSNDQQLAAFTNASCQASSSKIHILSATAVNSIPGSSVPPNVTTMTSKISVTYVGAVLGSYLLDAGAAKMSATGIAVFQPYIEIEEYGVPPIYLPMTISTAASDYGAISTALYFIAIAIVVAGFGLHRKGLA